jgi:hypothetical protein
LDTNIPTGASIEGIQIYIDRYNSFTGDGTVTINDDAIYLTKNGTDTVGVFNSPACACWSACSNGVMLLFLVNVNIGTGL